MKCMGMYSECCWASNSVPSVDGQELNFSHTDSFGDRLRCFLELQTLEGEAKEKDQHVKRLNTALKGRDLGQEVTAALTL